MKHETTEPTSGDTERLRILSELAREFSATTDDYEALLGLIARRLCETLGDLCVLRPMSADGTILESVGAMHHRDPELAALVRSTMAGPQRLGEGITGRVAATGEAVLIPVVDRARIVAGLAPDMRAFVERLRVASLIAVPLASRGRSIGVVCVTRGEATRPFDRHDLQLLRDAGAHAAHAIANARLVASMQQELAERRRMEQRLRLLADASREFAEATEDYDRLLGIIARRLGETIGDLCVIRAVDEDDATLETGAVHHRDPEIVAWANALLRAGRQRVGEGVMGRVVRSGEPVYLPRISAAEYAAMTSPQFREIIERLRVGSVMAVPLACRGKTIGVACMLRSGSDDPYTESDLHLLGSIADHAGLAIANARSFRAERAASAASVRANDALHESEAAHRILFEASPVPLLVVDVESMEAIAVNDAALRLFGYSREELLRLDLVELPVDGREASRARLAALGDREASGTMHYHRKDRSVVVAEYVTSALRFRGRRARITAFKDVTERDEAAQTRALLAAIVASSNDAVVSKDLDGIISSWNAAAERLFGYATSEAIGQPITILIPPARLEEESVLLTRVSAGERIDHFETIRRRKDGGDVFVSISLAPILDGAGEVIGVSKTARDLTERRRAEERLRHTEGQLRQAQKMEAVGRLAGGIAHDFNNMLSVILSYSALLLEAATPNDPSVEDLQEIRLAATRAAELTRQLLVFSRQQVIEPRVIDLAEVLAGMDKLLRRVLGEDVELTCSSAPRLGHVRADPSNVEQVIMNLVVNARDAMPRGGKLTVETRNVVLDVGYVREHVGATPGPHVMLAVTDTGVGMDAATQARVFEPFFTTKGPGKGTGLGLATVHGIAQQCGGSVWVYSEPGKGTTFKVYLPRVDAPTDAPVTAPPPTTLRGSETILLAEDHEQVRAVAQGILQRNGYRVVVAPCPEEALLLAQTHPGALHLLLTDVVMPQMSGAELAKRVASVRPEIRVLFMSGYTDDSVVRHGVLESGVAFLQKPFTPASLTRRVREVLNVRAP